MTAIHRLLRTTLYVFTLFLMASATYAQGGPSGSLPLTGQTNIRQYAIYAGGKHTGMFDSTSNGVTIHDNAIINGSIGSEFYIDIRNNGTYNGSMYSGNRIRIGGGNSFNGNIVALNDVGAGWSSIEVGNGAGNVLQLMHARGNINVAFPTTTGSYSVGGPVRVQAPYTYSGPGVTSGYFNVALLDMPEMPALPAPSLIPAYDAAKPSITSTTTLSPGVYNDINLSGGQTITFSQPGTYIFKSILAFSSNTFNFQFPVAFASKQGYRILVHEDAYLGSLQSRINGALPSSNSLPEARRIYLEAQGSARVPGAYHAAFRIMADAAPNESNWIGTVYTPNAGIRIDPETFLGSATVHGALWAKTQVYITRNVSVHHEPLAESANAIDPYFPQRPGGKVEPQYNKIGSELTSLHFNPGVIQSVPIFQTVIEGGVPMVYIEVIANQLNDAALASFLASLGFQTITQSPIHLTITGKIPIANLLQLNTSANINYVRPLFRPLNNRGLITSQGDTAMKAKIARERFGLDGTGVKIGVISDSYDNNSGAATDINQQDLPANVHVLSDFAAGRTDEGRAMMQIVHDVAPGAELAFRTGFNNAVDFAIGIKELADAGCKVIVDDLTYFTEPFFSDGIVARAVNDAVSSGVIYFTSAGNFGNNSYESVFNSISIPSNIAANIQLTSPASAKMHQFQNGSIFKRLDLEPGEYTVVMQWDNAAYSVGGNTGVADDLDMYIVGADSLPVVGFNRSNIAGDPLEIISFLVNERTTANLMVVSANGFTNKRFKFILLRGKGTIMDNEDSQISTSTIIGHANANSAIAVGAMLYTNPATLTPPQDVPYPSVASFSSRGGTVMPNEGARSKPDLVAPNGVNTSVVLNPNPILNIDGDSYANFFGTSAAAPHAAAVAALIIEAKKKFYQQPIVEPADVRNLMQATAQPLVGQSGHDFANGYGYIQADKTMLAIANARPVLRTLEVVDGNAQTGPFTIRVGGDYLTAATKIYINGTEVPGTIVTPDRRSASVVVTSGYTPAQNPPVQLYNPPITPSGLDGGLSEARYLFFNKKTVVVKADNKVRKYGEANPVFTFTATIDDTLISRLATPLTLADLQLDGNNVVMATAAEPTSAVRSYAITIGRNTALALSAEIHAAYDFMFVNGALAIEKMPLVIRPIGKTIRYGQDIGAIQYHYQLGGTLAGTGTLNVDSVAALHRRFIADNTIAVIDGYALSDRALVNYALGNMSLMASYQSLRNARKFTVSNGQLQPMVNTDNRQMEAQRLLVDVPVQTFTNYVNNSAQAPFVAGPNSTLRALLNSRALANGRAKMVQANGQLQAMVNGQLMAMVNGQLMAMVNGQLQAMVNGIWVDNVFDVTFQNGKLLAMVNAGGAWQVVPQANVVAIINGAPVRFDLSVDTNGQLQAMVNGQLMAMVNGQLQAMVNGRLMAMVNGQLMAMVNGQLLPMVNGEITFMVNGQLQAMVNGSLVNAQHIITLNGQLQAMVNGEWFPATNATYTTTINAQLYTINYSVAANGQLQAMVNGTQASTVNGIMQFALPNGQLLAMVNGKLLAMVNTGALLNGQLLAMVNEQPVYTDFVRVESNGQLQAMVNGALVRIVNGQLMAMVNGQLQAMVNGQLMAMVNTADGQNLTFATFVNGQLMAMVNGRLMPMVNSGAGAGQVNGQLQAMVNGQLQNVNSYVLNGANQLTEVTLANGQLLAMVNGQLQAMVNGQLQPMVNNGGNLNATNNSNTAVLVDGGDVALQGGVIGGMIAVNMITGLEAGTQKLVPAAFVHPFFDVSYEMGEVTILPAPLTISANDITKVYGDAMPAPGLTAADFVLGDDINDITPPVISTVEQSTAALLAVGEYPITLSGGLASNYTLILRNGKLVVTKAPLTIKADLKYIFQNDPLPVFTSTITGLKNTDVIPPAQIQYSASSLNTSIAGEFNNMPSVPATGLPYSNYNITTIAGKFYINPFGPNARKIVNRRECVRPLRAGDAGFGGVYTHMALFTYSNPNATPVYIPRGVDNEVLNLEAGQNNGVQRLPEVFLPGSNIEVIVLFQGQRIQWQVKSIDNYHKTAVTSEVNQTSPRCDQIVVTAGSNLFVSNEPEPVLTPGAVVYPNPARDKVRITLTDESVNEKIVTLVGADGKMQPARGVRRLSKETIEMDVSHLRSGLYIVRLNGNNGQTVVRFIKL